MFTRMSTVGAALIKATLKQVEDGKVDHERGAGNWVARRIAIDAVQGRHIGEITEYDHSPQRKKQARLEDGEGGYVD